MRLYIVKENDTLEGIARKQYGLSEESARIASANANITNLAKLKVGELLTIPDIDNADFKKNPLRVNAAGDTITLLINGYKFDFWPSIKINRSIDTIGDTFELTAPWLPENSRFRKIFKPFGYQDVVVYIGGEKIISGTAVNINPNSNANQKEVKISGYSRAAVLNDVMMPSSAFPLQFSNLTLLQIAQRLSTPFGIKVIFKTSPGAPFKNVVLAPDKKIYPFLIELATQRGIIISSDADGNMIFQKSTTSPATMTIIEGQPPFSTASVTFDGQQRYSSFAALGDGWKSGRGQIAVIEDPAIKKTGILRPFIYKATDIEHGDLKEAARSKLGRNIANSMQIDVTVNGLRDRNGNLWKDNQKVIFQSPGNMLHIATEYVIRDVEFIKDDKSEMSNLTLVFPEAFSGEIRTVFPWDL